MSRSSVGALVPRQVEHPVEVGADHAVLGGRRREALEPAELAVGRLAGLLGQAGRLDPLAQLVDLRLLLVPLPELLLDRPQLLAQVVLALALVDPLLDLRLDLGAERDHLELAGEDLREPPQPGADVDLLEDLLLLGGRDAQRSGDQVGERRGVLDVGDGELELLRQVRDLLDDLAEGALHVAGQRLQLRAPPRRRRGARSTRAIEVGLRGDVLADLDPLHPLDEDPDRAVGDLEHARDDAGDADRLELLRARLLELGVLRGDHDEAAVSGEHVVDQLDRALLADGERRQRPRVGDHVAHRQDRHRLRQHPGAAEQALLELVGGDDLDRGGRGGVPLELQRRHAGSASGSRGSIGTRRVVDSGIRIGSSTRSRPSSNVARADSASTSTPSSIARRNDPVGISTCW